MKVNTSNLGGPYQGFSAKQTIGNFQSGEHAVTRKILRDSWNTSYATGVVEGRKRAIGPFRAVNNLGDFLSRKGYSCGGPNPTPISKPGRRHIIGNMINNCDGTNIPASSTNVKFVPDASDYIKYKKQVSMNRSYNDASKGGDEHNGSYVYLMRVRRS